MSAVADLLRVALMFAWAGKPHAYSMLHVGGQRVTGVGDGVKEVIMGPHESLSVCQTVCAPPCQRLHARGTWPIVRREFRRRGHPERRRFKLRTPSPSSWPPRLPIAFRRQPTSDIAFIQFSMQVETHNHRLPRLSRPDPSSHVRFCILPKPPGHQSHMATLMAQGTAQTCRNAAARGTSSRSAPRLAAPALPPRMAAFVSQQRMKQRSSMVTRAVETDKPKVDPAKPEVAKIADSIGEPLRSPVPQGSMGSFTRPRTRAAFQN